MVYEYQPGDRVRIFQKLPDHWNPDGRMDHWLGKVVTIKERYGASYNIPTYQIEEDSDENNRLGWVWREDCLEPEFVVSLSEDDYEMLLGGE